MAENYKSIISYFIESFEFHLYLKLKEFLKSFRIFNLLLIDISSWNDIQLYKKDHQNN